jgi:glutaredoxin-like protein
MALLNDKVREQVKKEFENLVAPVKLVNFTQELECEFCLDTRRLIEEVASLSPRLSAEVYNFQIDKDKVQAYGIDKIPATVVVGAKDFGVRFYGIPSGYEFSSLVGSILDVSRGSSGFSQATRDAIMAIKQPVHIQVFTTPT